MAETGVRASGYVDDVIYTLGFHPELAPSFLDYACLVGGVDGLSTARRLRYCELGCGRGYSTILLAAANPDMDFVGVDFSPAHVDEARSLAKRAGLENLLFYELSFDDAARSGDAGLEAFDILTLHGVYSWVSAEVREEIHDFLATKLVSGGVAFISYNVMPGWTRVLPTQKLLFEAARRSQGDSIARIENAMPLLELLIDKSDGKVAKHGALSKKYLSHLGGRDRRYIVHEFLNAGWQPLYVSDVIASLAQAGLRYVASAAVGENRVELCVPKDLRDTVSAAPDAAMRELLKDFIAGKEFRRDVYVKAPQALTPQQQRQRLRDWPFALMPHVVEMPTSLKTPLGEIRPPGRVLDAMCRCVEGKVVHGATLIDAATNLGLKEERARTLVELLVHNKLIRPARSGVTLIDRSVALRLNDIVMDLSMSADTHRYLASPVLGSAIPASQAERILVPLLADALAGDELAIAQAAMDRIGRSGQSFMRDGRPVENNPENVKALAGFVCEFRTTRLPRWRMLGVI
ncbi:MAG: methyltransferase regulatory domain-containing protein [Alphaproteobacteria bacterium]|nr:methyltransferase regulatory domain-containing protein [Alphaproteobacteria bacterium]MCW5744309.1 methyltransferase regulatory domain-containing protein [Alphaproteobacteria bacterium]